MQTLYRKEQGHCINTYFKFIIGENVENIVYTIEERCFDAPVEYSFLLQQIGYDSATKYILENSEASNKEEWNDMLNKAKKHMEEME